MVIDAGTSKPARYLSGGSMSGPTIDVSDLPIDWHSAVTDTFESWGGTALTVRRRLGGKSGAFVLLVDAQLSDFSGLAILKLTSGANDEVAKQDLVRRSMSMVKDRVPTIVRSSVLADKTIVLMTVTANGLLEAEPLSEVQTSRQNLCLQKVGEDLFDGWNPDPHFNPSPTSTSHIINEWLGARLLPASRISIFLNDFLRVTNDSASFRYKGRDYPNPLRLGYSGHEAADSILNPARGRIHGDLHGENIICGKTSSVSPLIYYIDFDSFEADKPLLFDHAYLELSFLLRECGSFTIDHWARLVEGLSNVRTPQEGQERASDRESQGVAWSVGMLRQTVEKWISAKWAQRREDLHKQALISRVAAGINFANKKALSSDDDTSSKIRLKAFLYAARAAADYYDYCGFSIPTDGPILTLTDSSPKPTSSEWRDVWTACEQFDDRRSTFALLVGPGAEALTAAGIRAIGRLPWSLVLDFTKPGREGGDLIDIASPSIALKRALQKLRPHQVASVHFSNSTCWISAGDCLDAGVEPISIGEWRRTVPPKIRAVASAMRSWSLPKPVVVVVLADGLHAPLLRGAIGPLDEALGSAMKVVVVSADTEKTALRVLEEEGVSATAIECSIEDLALSVNDVWGAPEPAEGIWVPVKDREVGPARRQLVEPNFVTSLLPTVEIVPAGIRSGKGPNNEEADFFRGNTISWHELDLHRDADRDAVSSALSALRRILSGSPAESFAIDHTPGAGGTTVSRRIAWELRNEFPCVILKAYTPETAGAVQSLAAMTSLPVLLVCEASVLPGTLRDVLFSELKATGSRFVILDVRRRIHPRDTARSCAIVDPMTASESERFLQIYADRAPANRISSLERLARDQTMARYRSPFFFGLFAFEREFTRVENYVSDRLSAGNDTVRNAVAQLALITRYSQERLPMLAFLDLLDITPGEETIRLETVIPATLCDLIIFDGECVSIVHPLIAEVILQQHLAPSDTDEGAWQNNLSTFCEALILRLSSSNISDSASILNVLDDLFIDRGFWEVGTDSVRQFSELINQLPLPQSRRRVLEALCVAFPNQAHFWGHLGRLINMSKTGTFEEAEEKFNRALALEPDDDVHLHGLGMVYRFELKSRLRDNLEPGEGVGERFERNRFLFDKAIDCFDGARRGNLHSNYPLVTPIQMIIETIERLARMSGQSNLQAFIVSPSTLGDWSRKQVSFANVLLAQLRHVEANAEPSRYRTQVEAGLRRFVGDFTGFVASLNSLLRTHGSGRAPIRRLLANAYFERSHEVTAPHPLTELRHIVSLMEDNLAENSQSGYDTRTWLRAYRMLPEFSLNRAIEQLTIWAVSEDVDAYYYLHILHFFAARSGLHSSRQESKKYLELCRRRAPILLSKKSFEWIANPSLNRPLSLAHHSELGDWSKESDFFEREDRLDLVEGRIDEISSPQAGVIIVDGFPAFFTPRSQFRRGADLNRRVRLNLGFSYEGLRAWNVRGID